MNLELSLALKKKYRHRIRQCYSNAKKLFEKKEIDSIVYGYTLSVDSNCFVRHCWGIKCGKIVDSTFRREELEQTTYYPMFSFNSLKDYYKAMLITTGPAMLELDANKESAFKERLTEETGIIVFT